MMTWVAVRRAQELSGELNRGRSGKERLNPDQWVSCIDLNRVVDNSGVLARTVLVQIEMQITPQSIEPLNEGLVYYWPCYPPHC